MGYVSNINLNGVSSPITSSLCGTCSTAAATAAKVVTCSDFNVLKTGVMICVNFTYANTANNPTLNVNGTGAKAITRGGYAVKIGAGVSQFVYDGTNWAMTTNDSEKTELGGQVTTGTAGEAIVAGEFVYTTNNSTWYKAVSGLNRNYTGIGIAVSGASSGSSFTLSKIIARTV